MGEKQRGSAEFGGLKESDSGYTGRMACAKMEIPAKIMRFAGLTAARGIVALVALAATCMAQGGIDVFLPGRHVETILALPVGLSMQKALLEDGTIILTDTNNQRIALLGTDGVVKTLAQLTNVVDSRGVAALPGDRVVYCVGGEIRVHDIHTGQIQRRGAIPSGEWSQALGSDTAGNVYAATSQNNLYRFDPDGRRDWMASNLPFTQISDVAVGRGGEVYVAGSSKVVKVDSARVTVVSDGLLNSELGWVAIRPDGKLYINDSVKHLQLYDPATGEASSVALPTGFSLGRDILVPSDEEILFQSQAAYFRYNLVSGAVTTVFTIDGNNKPFAVAGDGFLYIGTIWRMGVLNSRLARIGPGGAGKFQYLDSVPITMIQALEADSRGRLGLIEGNQLKRVEADGSLSTFSRFLPPNFFGLAMSSDGDWYVTTTNWADTIRIYRVREGGTSGQVIATIDNTVLPDSRMVDVSAAITPKGELAMVVSATTSAGHSYQRVYRANLDGSDFREVANLDSQRMGCQVDISAAPNGDLYVLGCVSGTTGTHNSIFLIDESNVPREAVRIATGNDPSSLWVDDQGNLWFSATNGVYRVPAAPANVRPRIMSVLGVLNGGSWSPEIAPNTWISIFGTNLASGSRSWMDSDFVDNRLPTQLDGVGVSIGGKPAYIAYISPTQLNVLVPDLEPGPYEIKAATPIGTTNIVSMPITQFAPALFRFDAAGGRYAAAVHPDGSYVGDPALLAGLAATPARPGEVVSLYGSGFGPVVGNADMGAAISNAQNLANAVTLKIGGVNATVKFAGLVGAGLVQLNVEVPKLADGDQPVTGSIGGVPLRNNPFITVQSRP
jgi:uncharacterized protein (TIGR03437 family)